MEFLTSVGMKIGIWSKLRHRFGIGIGIEIDFGNFFLIPAKLNFLLNNPLCMA
jgi:hypothetical protein